MGSSFKLSNYLSCCSVDWLRLSFWGKSDGVLISVMFILRLSPKPEAPTRLVKKNLTRGFGLLLVAEEVLNELGIHNLALWLLLIIIKIPG